MALVEVKVPDIGDFEEVAVIELLVKPGDTVKAEQSLITVESDKASMEIPSSHAGVVKELKVKLGDKVKRRARWCWCSKRPARRLPRPRRSSRACAGRAAPAPAAAPPHRARGRAGGGGAGRSRVPDIGDFKDVAVIEVLVKPGDTVKVEQIADHGGDRTRRRWRSRRRTPAW